MRDNEGMSLVEVLIALVIVGIAFTTMAFVQTNNLKMTTNARLTTTVKAAANQVLEAVMTDVLETTVSGSTKTFAFNDYYWTCPTPSTPPSGALAVVNTPSCSGTTSIGDVDVTHAIVGEGGVTGEGVLTVTVTAVHVHGGQRLTLGDRVTCYDIYPSPTSLAPQPCPTPTSTGGGRP